MQPVGSPEFVTSHCQRYTRDMHLRTIVLLVALFLGWAGPSAWSEEITEHSFLWAATKGDRTVHLLGSIHFMKPDAYPLSQAIESAYEGSGLLAFETDIREMSRASVALIAAGTLSDGLTLEDVISPDLYRELSERLEVQGTSAAIFQRMTPWMVALGLTSFELMRGGYLGSEGIDVHFSSRASTDGKEQTGLESIEDQISLFADLSAEESEEFLDFTLKDLETVIPLVDEVFAAWQVGDAEALEKLLTEGFENHPELYRRMVVVRNLKWMPRVESLFDGSVDAMVVVGSLHLVGEHGLVELLKAKGYEVEQR